MHLLIYISTKVNIDSLHWQYIKIEVNVSSIFINIVDKTFIKLLYLKEVAIIIYKISLLLINLVII